MAHANANTLLPVMVETGEALENVEEVSAGMEPRRVNCGRELVGLDHIVFGTDYFIRSTRFIEWTRSLSTGSG
jgi:hypothetical protein